MTDYEVWMEIATHMERSGMIPQEDNTGIWKPNKNSGLCEVIYIFEHMNIISIPQCDRMLDDLRYHFGVGKGSFDYFWPKNKIEPRIKACKFLARKAKKQLC